MKIIELNQEIEIIAQVIVKELGYVVFEHDDIFALDDVNFSSIRSQITSAELKIYDVGDILRLTVQHTIEENLHRCKVIKHKRLEFS